jgi:cytochrome c5
MNAKIRCALVVLTCISLPAFAQSAAESYMERCAVCHLPGIAGAPKVGDQAEWTKRVRAGRSAVYRNTLEGIPNTAMMAYGGADDLGAAQIRAIVDYMLAAAQLSPETLAASARYEKLGIGNRDFIRRDANFDGFLTADELAGDDALLRAFARFDTNADRRLSVAEFENAEAVLERERRAIRIDDRTLAATVRAALARVKGLDLGTAKLAVADGVVAVVGIVEEPYTAVQVYDTLKRIPGVQRIDNRLVSGHQIGWD